MIRLVVAAAATLTALQAGFAAPSSKEYKAVPDKQSVTLDPSKSYLIVQLAWDAAASSPLTFLRRPGPAEVEDYRARRQAALTKAHAKWQRAYAEWQASLASWQKLSRTDRAQTPAPVEPVEPTDAAFAFPALEQENMVMIGPLNRFARGNGLSTFVHMVPPGRYVFYGSLDLVNGGGSGCMCMGTIEFEVRPGEIAYAGVAQPNWILERARAKAEGREPPATPMDLPERMTSFGWAPPAADAAIDPRLSSYKIVPVTLHPAGPFANYYGVEIDRLTAIPGVLDYDRDRIIGVDSETHPVPAPLIR